MPTDKISVIIATQNRAEMLAKCINGLASQTYHNFEVIIINSGNNKIDINRYEFIGLTDKINKKSLTVINSAEKLLASKAWNKGIKLAKGKIFAFIDDDAIPENNWLEEISKYFKLHPTITAINGRIGSVSFNTVSDRIRQSYYDFRDYQYSRGMYDVINKNQYGLITEETGLSDWLSMANCAVRKKYLNNFLFDGQICLNAGHKLGHELISKGFLVSYNPLVRIKHHHYRRFHQMLKTKFINGKYFYNIDSEFGITYKKRLDEIYEYIKFLNNKKNLKIADKVIELIFTVVLILSYLSENFKQLLKNKIWRK